MLRRGRATDWEDASSRPWARARFTFAALAAVVALFSCGQIVPDAPPYNPGDDGGPGDEASAPCSVDIYTDVNNCGACGILCPSEDTCSQGVCIPPPPDASLACDSRQVGCGPDQICCENRCLDGTSDPLNCGGCGIVCPSGVACIGSVCGGCYYGETCTAAQACCPITGCADLQTDPTNCGACGWGCPAGDTCAAGKCSFPCQEAGACPGSDTCCGTGCTNTQTDPANCGGCGVQCGATATCLDGTCAANEGAFNPTVNPTYLPPGGHYFTTINVPAGVTVYVAGTGTQSATLDLHATGAIEIDGTIDLSGGPGTQNSVVSLSDGVGARGAAVSPASRTRRGHRRPLARWSRGPRASSACRSRRSPGNCDVASTSACVSSTHPDKKKRPLLTLPDAGSHAARVRRLRGLTGRLWRRSRRGHGGTARSGAEEGGPRAEPLACPGVPSRTSAIASASRVEGERSTGSVATGAARRTTARPAESASRSADSPRMAGRISAEGGAAASARPRRPTSRSPRRSRPAPVEGEGASTTPIVRTSEGPRAVAAVAAPSSSRPPRRSRSRGSSSPTEARGVTPILALPPPRSTAATRSPEPQEGAVRAGSSICPLRRSWSRASASLSAAGGSGGAQSQYATGGAGGAGGLGRIRLSVSASTCSLSGTFQPPLAAGCQVTAPPGKAGTAFIGTYPN